MANLIRSIFLSLFILQAPVLAQENPETTARLERLEELIAQQAVQIKLLETRLEMTTPLLKQAFEAGRQSAQVKTKPALSDEERSKIANLKSYPQSLEQINCEIGTDQIQEALQKQEQGVREASFVKYYVKGKGFLGQRIFNLSEESDYKLLKLMNGDIIHRIDGELFDPQKQNVFSLLRKNRKVALEIVRVTKALKYTCVTASRREN